jgi:hypothetical protein
MNYLQIIQELEQIAHQLDLQIRHEKGDFEGGYCVLKDQKVLVVNKRLVDSRKASAMALALAEFGVESIYLKPAIRTFIEDEIAKTRKGKESK